MIPTQGEAHKLNNWKLLKNEVSDKKGLWYSRERAPGSKCNVDRRRGRYATNFSLWLLHYRLTILESFESLRQHTWSLHTFENKSLSKWNNVYNWNINIDLHIFRHRERFRISIQCYTIIWLLAFFFLVSKTSRQRDWETYGWKGKETCYLDTYASKNIFIFQSQRLISFSTFTHVFYFFLEKRRFW